MKFLSALAATCFASGVWSAASTTVKRDRQLIDDILTQNLADVAALQEAVNNFNGDETPLVEAADSFIQNLVDAKPQVDASGELSLDDTLAISPKVGQLINDSQELVDTFKTRLPEVEQFNQCDTVREKLEAISTNSRALIESINNKVAAIAKPIAQELADQLIAILNQGIEDYKQCNNDGGSTTTGSASTTRPPNTDTSATSTQTTSYGNATTTHQPTHPTDDCITMTKTTKTKPPPGQTECPSCPPPECPPGGCPTQTQMPTDTDRPPVITAGAAVLAPAGGFLLGIAALLL